MDSSCKGIWWHVGEVCLHFFALFLIIGFSWCSGQWISYLMLQSDFWIWSQAKVIALCSKCAALHRKRCWSFPCVMEPVRKSRCIPSATANPFNLNLYEQHMVSWNGFLRISLFCVCFYRVNVFDLSFSEFEVGMLVHGSSIFPYSFQNSEQKSRTCMQRLFSRIELLKRKI